MRYLANVSRSAYRGKAGCEAENETSTHKHMYCGRLCLDACCDDSEESAYEHSHSSAKGVVDWAGEGYSRHLAEVV